MARYWNGYFGDECYYPTNRAPKVVRRAVKAMEALNGYIDVGRINDGTGTAMTQTIRLRSLISGGGSVFGGGPASVKPGSTTTMVPPRVTSIGGGRPMIPGGVRGQGWAPGSGKPRTAGGGIIAGAPKRVPRGLSLTLDKPTDSKSSGSLLTLDKPTAKPGVRVMFGKPSRLSQILIAKANEKADSTGVTTSTSTTAEPTPPLAPVAPPMASAPAPSFGGGSSGGGGGGGGGGGPMEEEEQEEAIEAPPEEKKPFPWLLVGGAAAILYFMSKQK